MNTGAKIRRDYIIPSSDGENIAIDLYFPSNAKGRTCVVFVHGGGFIGGDKDQFLGAATYLTLMKGTVCVSVQYRTDTPYPRPVLDVIDTINFLNDNAEELGISRDAICLCGGSPGANISLLAMCKAWREKNKVSGYIPRYGIFLNGIYDLVRFYKKNENERESLCRYFGTNDYQKLLEEASPIKYTFENSSMTFLHGTADKVVEIEEAISMKEHIESCGGKVTLIKFENEIHAWFNKDIKQYEVWETIGSIVDEIEGEMKDVIG